MFARILSKFSYPRSRFFSKHIKEEDINTILFNKMNVDDRINLAVTISDPDTANIAYYKGLGLKKMGTEFSSEAIHAFKQAIELDQSYNAICKNEIDDIYAQLGIERRKKPY